MSRSVWIHAALAVVIALAALFFIRLHNASGDRLPTDSASLGHRLAEAWCKECHAIGATTTAPAFIDIVSQPSTTALSLKVFLRSNHPSIPNLVMAPDQADDLVNYILSLKRN